MPIVGGHSVEDTEPKYGLAVTGVVHPDRVLTKKKLRTGDQLILTKALGTGIINTAIKGGLAPADLVERDPRRSRSGPRIAPSRRALGSYPGVP